MENIRQTEYNNEIWYVVKDICDVLKMKHNRSMSKSIPDKFKKILKINTNGGKQSMIVVNIDGVKKIIQSSRSINKDKLITNLNIELDIVYDCKESSYLKIISSSFKKFSQIFQYKVGIYRIDLYLPEYKLAIEVDEFDHCDRDKIYEKERQNFIEKELNCKFIRFNPDQKNFNIGDIISIILDETLLK